MIFIREYKNSKHASEITGFSKLDIIMCCIGKISEVKNYKFKYKY